MDWQSVKIPDIRPIARFAIVMVLLYMFWEMSKDGSQVNQTLETLLNVMVGFYIRGETK